MSPVCEIFFLWMTAWLRPLFSFKKVRTSPTRLGVRAFQNCQGVSLWTFLPLVCGHHIRPGNFEMLSRLNKSDLCGLFLTEWQPDLDHSSVKKSPHNSNSFRHESISKLPDLIWWPQTKDKKTFIGLPPGNFEMLSRLNELDLCGLFNRPGVAGAVLQTPPSLIN